MLPMASSMASKMNSTSSKYSAYLQYHLSNRNFARVVAGLKKVSQSHRCIGLYPNLARYKVVLEQLVKSYAME